MIKFKKMHGLGNDFVVIDARTQSIDLTQEQIIGICDRNFGVGCDLLTILLPSDKADIRVEFYNADGSQSGACGNATRCVADLFMRQNQKDSCSIEAGDRVLQTRRAEMNMITVDMGAPVNVRDLPLERQPVGVDMGNPHCVFFVDDLGDIDVEKQGSSIEINPLFPNRTNVEYVQVLGENKLRQKTWERGAGLTLACGSGACAVAVAAVTRGLTGRKVEIILDGGSLYIGWRESDGHVMMTGSATDVFDGTINTL